MSTVFQVWLDEERQVIRQRLNPHLHAIAVDGAYLPGPDGQPSFRALPRLKTDEVADVLQVACVRILRFLARRGVVHLLPEALEIDDELAARDPVLAQLAHRGGARAVGASDPPLAAYPFLHTANRTSPSGLRPRNPAISLVRWNAAQPLSPTSSLSVS